MKNSIIIAIDNDFYLINNFFEHLLDITDFNYSEIIIVSDACKNIQTIDYLNELNNNKNIKFIRLDKKSGYSVANNVAVSHACGEYLTFINSDVFPKKNSIEILIDSVENEEADIAQGLLVFPQNNLVQSTGHLFLNSISPHVFQNKKTDDPVVLQKGVRQALTTAFLTMKKDTFYKYGCFDEFYYNAYEGRELTLKVTLDGGICMYIPEAFAYHCVGGTRKIIPRNESQQKGHFWSRWSDRIRVDIADYILMQMTDEILNNEYYIINCSYLKDWDNVIEQLRLHISGKTTIDDRFGGVINLYYNLPYSSLKFQGNYLFIANSINELLPNKNWFSVRNNSNDIIIDANGNLKKIGYTR